MTEAAELSRLFAAERAVRSPAAAAERGLTRLLADVAVQAAPLPIAAGALKLTSLGVSKWILAGFAVGIASSGVASRAWSPSQGWATSAPVPAPRAAAFAAALPMASTAVAQTTEPDPAPKVALPGAGERPLKRVVAAATGARSAEVPFDAELRLITAAKAELDAGRSHLADAWLNEHAARFPRGVFSTDRDALRVLARCADRRDESSARAFAARHPGSSLIPRLLRACHSLTAADSANETPLPREPTHE